MEQAVDSISSLQDKFFELLGWNVYSQYHKFNQAAKDILEIKVHNGLTLSSNNQQFDNFKSQYILGLNPRISASIAYLSSSFGIPSLQTDSENTEQRQFDTQKLKQDVVPPEAGVKTANKLNNPSSNYPRLLKSINRRPWDQAKLYSNDSSDYFLGSKRPYLLAVQAYLELRTVTGLYIKQLNKESQLKLNWVTVADKMKSSYAVSRYTINKDRWASAFTLVANTGLCGLSGVYHINGRISDLFSQSKSTQLKNGLFTVGCELYYCIKDSGGGVSLGFKSTTNEPSQFAEKAVIINPLMGHLTLSYCQQISKNIIGASKFDYNYYNYLSEMSLGFEYWGRLNNESKLTNSKLGFEFGSGNGTLPTAPQLSNETYGSKIYDYLLKMSISVASPQPKQLYSTVFQLERQFGNILVSLACGLAITSKADKNQASQLPDSSKVPASTLDKDRLTAIALADPSSTKSPASVSFGSFVPRIDKLSLQVHVFL